MAEAKSIYHIALDRIEELEKEREQHRDVIAILALLWLVTFGIIIGYIIGSIL